MWQIKKYNNSIVRNLQMDGISELLSKLLTERGIDNSEDAKRFIHPLLKDMDSPLRFSDMKKSVNRILEAINKKENIAIYGDYDADGITATTLLVKFFRTINVNVKWYIPNRLTEGYGLHCSTIERIASDNINLIITVDNGISSIEPVKLANKLNIDVIITDHHTVPDVSPPAYSIVHPYYAKIKDKFPPSGAGIAFNLIIALRSCLRKEGFKNLPNLKQFMDIAAVGTIADVVPLINTNRIIVNYGLKHISKKNSSLAINQLLKNKDKQSLDSSDISFGVAPCINAAGRMGDAKLAMQLFLTDDAEKVSRYAGELSVLNNRRRKLQADILLEAKEKVSSESDKKIIVVSGKWHIGIIGIIAGRLTEIYDRPAIVISTDSSDDIASASGRSRDGTNLFAIVKNLKSMLVHFGGHPQAVGFSIGISKIDLFKMEINKTTEAINEKGNNEISYDDKINFSHINKEFYFEIEKMKPFGEANPEPLFYSENVMIEEKRVVGRGHWKMNLSQNGKIIPAIFFNAERMVKDIKRSVDLLWNIKMNRWAGKENIELNIRGIRNVKAES